MNRRAYLRHPNPIIPRTTAWRQRRRADEDEENNPPDDTAIRRSMTNGAAQENAHVELSGHGDMSSEPAAAVDQQEQNTSPDETADHELDQHDEETLSPEQADNEEHQSPNFAGEDKNAKKWKKKIDELNVPLYAGVRTTKLECFFMVLHFYLRHGITDVALVHLFKLINAIFDQEVISERLEIFQNLFNGSLAVQHHLYCPTCSAYLGDRSTYDKKTVSVPCPACDEACSVWKGDNYFAYIPIEQQLRSMLENTAGIVDELDYRFNREVSPDYISDIYDGSVYQSLCKDDEFFSNANNLSISFAADGAPVWKGATNSCWPIQFIINELPPERRFDRWNCLLAGLYFGKHDPEMSCFMTPFIRECHKLYNDGFRWTNPASGEVVISKVIALNCVADSVAKPKIQCIRQFNGYFGCPYCDHPGVRIAEHSHPRFLIDEDSEVVMTPEFGCEYTATRNNIIDENGHITSKSFRVTDRTNTELRGEMREAFNSGSEHVKGAKGLSVLCALPFFDVVFGLTLDYMHAILIGSQKQVLELWFDSKNHEQPWYLKDKMNEIDKRLMNIKPPSNISRRPRSLALMSSWHANEYRNFLLYYSLPCFSGLMKPKYLKHQCLIVSAIFILLQDRISRSELEEAAGFLVQYVREFQTLYGAVSMNFNVHLLLHLTKSVHMYGPVWCFSAFCFESGNGSLVKLVRGTVSVVGQIARKYVMSMCTTELCRQENISEHVMEFCSGIISYSAVRNVKKVGSVTLLGTPLKTVPTVEEARALCRSGVNLGYTYARMIKDRIKYHSAGHYLRQGKKSNDSVVRMADGEYGLIERIFMGKKDDEESVYVFVRKINIDRGSVVLHPIGAKAKHIRVCSPIVFSSISVKPAVQIARKALFIHAVHRKFVGTIPNFLEKD